MRAMERPRSSDGRRRGLVRRRLHRFKLSANAAGGLRYFGPQQFHAGARQPIRGAGNADRAPHHAGCVHDGRPDTAHAQHDFFIIDGVASRRGDLQFRIQAAPVGNGVRGEGFQRHIANDVFTRCGFHDGQDRLALAGAMHRLALSQHGCGSHAMRAVAAL
ncbi:hypothetical protein D3C86_1554170 [compost metagenome]